MSDPFLDNIGELFEKKDYLGVIKAWGIDTSNSHEFKAAAYANYQPQKNDVIVSTYPKCGTTWMNQICAQIGFKGRGDYEHIDAIVPWPDKLVPIDFNPEIGDKSRLEGSPTGLQVIKGHLESDYIPINDDARYINIIRNPKDAFVSMVHFENGFNQLLFGESVPVDAWIEAFGNDGFIYQPWALVTHSWWKLRNLPNVSVLLFEDMKGDPRGTVKNVAEFLDIDLTDKDFELVCEKSSFQYMKENEHMFAPPAWDEGPVNLVREGKTGSSKTELSDEQRQRIDTICINALAEYGSDFPYQEVYGEK